MAGGGHCCQIEHEIWVPDVFSPTTHILPVVSKNAFWIAPTGRVWWARRMVLNLNCAMDFRHMPFDTQLCNVKFTGFYHLGLDVIYRIPNGTDYGPEYDFLRAFRGPVRAVCPDSGTVEWAVTSITGESIFGGQAALVPFSYVEYHFELTRARGFFEQYVIAPMVLLVIITWATFWISRDAVPARVSMVIIAYLNMSSLLSSTNASLPHLSGRGSGSSRFKTSLSSSSSMRSSSTRVCAAGFKPAFCQPSPNGTSTPLIIR